MSDSDWRRNYTLGLIAAFIFAALVGGAIWAFAAGSEAQSHHRAERYATQYANESYKRIERECFSLPALQQSECIDKEREAAREGQRKEYDLEAQQTMAAWTKGMGLAAAFGLVVGITGLGLIYVTFQATRRAADEARRSADAFIVAERGWLSVEFKHKEVQAPDDPITQRVFVELSGRSGVEVTALHWIVLSKPHYPGESAPFEVAELSRRIEPASPNKPVQIKTIKLEGGTKYVGGWVSYTTKFPGERRTYFVGKIAISSTFGNGGVAYRLRLRRDSSWPDNT